MSVGYNQEVPLTIPLTKAVGNITGRVVAAASSPSGADLGVGNPTYPGTVVTLSGITGYNGTTPVVSTVPVNPDANGCFAIVKVATDPAPAGCTPSGATIPTAVLPLVTTTLTASVVSPNALKAFTQQNISVATGTLLVLRGDPIPSAISGTITTNNGSAGVDFSKVTFTVPQLAPGAGLVSITASTGGQLTWSDPTQGGQNKARPGTYQITASLSGYDTATATVVVNLGQAATITGLVLQQHGSLTVRVVAGSKTGPAVTGAVVTLDGGTASSQTLTPTAGSNAVTFGDLTDHRCDVPLVDPRSRLCIRRPDESGERVLPRLGIDRGPVECVDRQCGTDGHRLHGGADLARIDFGKGRRSAQRLVHLDRRRRRADRLTVAQCAGRRQEVHRFHLHEPERD